MNLEYNSLTSIPDGAFEGMRRLKVLWLTGHHLREDDTPAEEYSALAPKKNTIEEVSEHAFDGNPNLAVLLMHHNQISTLADTVFAPVGASLRVLKLADNRIAPEKLQEGVGPLKPLTHVKQLDLMEDSGDHLEDWMEEEGHYLDDSNGDESAWWAHRDALGDSMQEDL